MGLCLVFVCAVLQNHSQATQLIVKLVLGTRFLKLRTGLTPIILGIVTKTVNELQQILCGFTIDTGILKRNPALWLESNMFGR